MHEHDEKSFPNLIFYPEFCINRLVGADHYKPKLQISTNLRSWTNFASSEHANENCTKIAQILRHMDESCTQIARIASDEKCAEIARKIARKIQSGQSSGPCQPGTQAASATARGKAITRQAGLCNFSAHTESDSGFSTTRFQIPCSLFPCGINPRRGEELFLVMSSCGSPQAIPQATSHPMPMSWSPGCS